MNFCSIVLLRGAGACMLIQSFQVCLKVLNIIIIENFQKPSITNTLEIKITNHHLDSLPHSGPKYIFAQNGELC